jgi:hypothetical protein
MSLPQSEGSDRKVMRTAHAMLVPWGRFARHIGLIQGLEEMPIPQRTRDHTPQGKLLEFLVTILSGCSYLQDISGGPHPLDRDQAVAEAWGQSAWADYSGVSRTLHACTMDTVTSVRAVVERVSRPFTDAEVVRALCQDGFLVYDGDLTGRPVSNSSTTYPGATFGWMDDGVHLGYQAALVSLQSPTYGRQWLTVTPHAGDTVSSAQAEALVQAAEARTGVRPLRRTDLLSARIGQRRGDLEEAQRRGDTRQTQFQRAREKMRAATEAWRRALIEVARLVERDGPPKQAPRPYSQLSKARHAVGVCWRRLQRRAREMERIRQAMARPDAKVQQLQHTLAILEARLARFLDDNAHNRAPVRAIFRLDGGFGSGENLALLIEMGYEVYSKALSAKVTDALRRRIGVQMLWTRVGDNAEMMGWSDLKLDCCPYALDVGLERFHTGAQERYATLVHYGPQLVTRDLPAWFTFYNGRQTIEAGVKEGKGVFAMHHLKVRSTPGLAIQEEFAVLAANLVRWASVWLAEQAFQSQPPFDRRRSSVKQMVRVGANTTALVFEQPEGNLLLRFDELSPLEGLELRMGRGAAFQAPLPLFRNDIFVPI